MPSEYVRVRFFATASRPTSASTSSTRVRAMPLVCAMNSRWLYALRPGCTAFASSSAPTLVSGARSAAYRCPSMCTVPAVGRSSPMIARIVVDLPAPLGPRKPVTRPGSTVKLEVVDGEHVAVPLGESDDLDHLHTAPARRGCRDVIGQLPVGARTGSGITLIVPGVPRSCGAWRGPP